jgi:PAS domain S-box-containing protein
MNSVKVLIVDDEPEHTSLLAGLLKRIGYETLSACNGAEALARLRSEDVDIIISDVLMPVMDGFRFCQEVRAEPRWQDLLFVFLTASYLDDRDEKFGLMLGADRYVRKPIELATLVEILQDLVTQRQEGRLRARTAYTEERELLKLYNERLVHKLEQKIRELNHELAERRRVEAELQELGRKHQLIFQAAGEVIVGLDLEARITFVNPAVVNMAGYTTEELIGKDFHQALHHTKPDGTLYPAIECPHYNAVRAGIVSPLQDELLWRKDGSSFYASYRTTPIIERGEVMGAVLVMRDASDRRQAEAIRSRLEGQLRQVQQMEALGALAGGIAHEFNNIIGIVLGYAELGCLKGGRDNPLAKDLHQIIQAGYRARDLVKQIGVLRQRTESERHRLQVYLVVKEALKLIRASLPATIEIRADVSSKGTALADPTQMYQVLMNLCTNAFQAMREGGGLLEVSLVDVAFAETPPAPELLPGPYLQLTVTDTGHGMTPEVMGRIFEPSFTTKEQGDGAGLGLSVVRSIITNHHGAITVSSEPGKGSTFKLFLPRLEDTVEVESIRLERLASGKERILIVDDDEALVGLGQQVLLHLGYKVMAMTNSLEALAVFKQAPGNFDLLITNQTMPHMTGAQLARNVLSIRPDLPIILCTGYSDAIPQVKALGIGIREYLMKPLGIGVLAGCVQRVLNEDQD